MTNIPRWQGRIEVFNNFYSDFQNCLEAQQEFALLKTCYEFYSKSLRDILNEKGEGLYLPSQVLVEAQKFGLIDDADVWLDYIQELNEYYQTYGEEEKQNLRDKIVDKYKLHLSNASLNLNTFYNNRYIDNVLVKNAVLDKELKSIDIGVMESSYNLLMQAFEDNQDIKSVWIHGSRAKGNARKCSDIDLIIDIDVERIEDCKKQLDNLPIPYRVDFVSCNDSTCELFLRKIIPDAKLIYCIEDN